MSLKAFLAGMAVALMLVGGLAAAYFLGDSRHPNTSQQLVQQALPPSLSTIAPVATAPPSAATPPLTCGLDQINRAAKGTVRLETYEATGSGFLISDDVVVTNEHVIDGYSRVSVQFSDSSRGSGTVLAVSKTLDIALVRLQSGRGNLALNWGDSGSLRGSQPVIAIGFPLSVSGPPVFTRGSVSRVYRDSDGDDLVQTDASINPGNSGGPLVDECGMVMGVVTWRVKNAAGLGFAQASSQVQPEVDRLMGRPSARPPGLAPLPPSPAPQTEQEQAVSQYYSYIGAKDYVRAFDLLSAGFKSGGSFASWQQGYLTTQSVQVKSIELVSGTLNQVAVSFIATDLKNGSLVSSDFSGVWYLVQESGRWKIDRGVISAVQSSH